MGSTDRIYDLQDTATLGVVVLKHCGYTATVRVSGHVRETDDANLDIVVDDQPDGGSNALNINRFAT